jgi:hypothetical protein
MEATSPLPPQNSPHLTLEAEHREDFREKVMLGLTIAFAMPAQTAEQLDIKARAI